MNIDTGTTLNGVSLKTVERDNTRIERIKALKVLTDQGWSLSDAMSMLGIEREWVIAPSGDSRRAPEGLRRVRHRRSGPMRL